ncbi:MAG: hypothetical protein WC486_00335 [Candidatus Omnitrophota bacterium]
MYNMSQNESHDWFADAAESFVRYYFARSGFIVFGSSKWGADCIIQDENGRKLAIEVKSQDNKCGLPACDKKVTRNGRGLRDKLKRVKADIYAEVWLKKEPMGMEDGVAEIKIYLWKVIDGYPSGRAFSNLRPDEIKRWVLD